jgi:hypothetical protein
MKNILDIDAIGLHAPRPAVDLQAGRLHDPAIDAAVLEDPNRKSGIPKRPHLS